MDVPVVNYDSIIQMIYDILSRSEGVKFARLVAYIVNSCPDFVQIGIALSFVFGCVAFTYKFLVEVFY